MYCHIPAARFRCKRTDDDETESILRGWECGGVLEAAESTLPIRSESIHDGIIGNCFSVGVVTEELEPMLEGVLILNDKDIVVRVKIGSSHVNVAETPGIIWRAARPTAFFAGNDMIALGVLLAVREIGLRRPEDISVLGFDNLDLLKPRARPYPRSINPVINWERQPLA
jgi:hypothetical protein